MIPSIHHCGGCGHAGSHGHVDSRPTNQDNGHDPAINTEKTVRTGEPIRVGAVFITASAGQQVWPYINFDYASRIKEIQNRLSAAHPELMFDWLEIQGAAVDETARVEKLADSVDGLLVFVLATNWPLTETLFPAMGNWGLPLVLVDEPYAGSGVFLCHGAAALNAGGQAVMVSSCRFQDVLDVIQCFSGLRKPDADLATFMAEAETVRRRNFALPCDMRCKSDPVPVHPRDQALDRLRGSTILRVIGEKSSASSELGVTVKTATFDEINAAYQAVDPAEAEEWAERWIEEADQVVEPDASDIRDSAAIYLAMKQLMDRYEARAITVDCLGGFYSGKLPGYPCLGYRQLNDDGVAMGTCEARVPDALAMLLFRDLFDRASFASDPVLDTSTNRIIYAHCVAPTRMLGPAGPTNPFRIRSHAEDNLGASIQSIMPTGYMTTTIGFDHDLKAMVMHQAKAVANIDEPRACRTKLAAEVNGDIEKLFHQWDRFAWHRVTAFGDLREPLEAVADALELEVIQEAQASA